MRAWFSMWLTLGLLLSGCPAQTDDDDDSADDDDAQGDDDASGDDDTLGDDDAGGDDDVGDDDTSGDDDDATPHPDAPVISNCQMWIEWDEKYQTDDLMVSVDYTDPQGDLSGGEFFLSYGDINGMGSGLGGPTELPDGKSGTFESFAAFVGKEYGLPPGYTVEVDIRISDGEMFWSNELTGSLVIP